MPTSKAAGADRMVRLRQRGFWLEYASMASAATLLGVGLNAWLGWWWADPVAALVIAALAVKEGLEALEDQG